MPINKLVSVNNVIINLMDSLGLDHTKYKPVFTSWAVTAEKEIGSFYQYVKKIAVLDIKGCSAAIPEDAQYLQLAVMGDFGCDCSDLFARIAQTLGNVNVQSGNINSVSFLVVDLPAGWTAEGGNFNCNRLNYDIQNNNLILDVNRNGEKVTIQYIGIKTDSDGIPLVGANHLQAIEEYCMWKFRRRRVRSGIDVGLYRDHKNEYDKLVARARGDDAEITESERENIVNMLHDPYIGRGLQLVPTIGYYSSWPNLS